MTHQPRRARLARILTVLMLFLALALSGCAYMTIEQRDTTVVGRDQGAP